jgi:hypothetical protein
LLVSTDSIIVLTEQEDCVLKCELPVQIADFRDIPNDEYKCILTMPTLKLQEESILHGALPGDRYSISAKDGAVYLTSTNFNDFTVTKRILSSSNQVNIVIDDTLPAVTGIPHLLQILLNALMMSCESTTLGVADEIPFKLSQSLTEVTNMQGKAEHVGDLSYFLMPFPTGDAENDVFVMAGGGGILHCHARGSLQRSTYSWQAVCGYYTESRKRFWSSCCGMLKHRFTHQRNV